MKKEIYILLTLVICWTQRGVASVGRPQKDTHPPLFQKDTLAAFFQKDTLAAIELHPYGRYLYNERKELELVSSAVHFGFSFQGDRCAVYASVKDAGGHGYLQYEVDGHYEKRVRVNGNSPAPLVIKAPGAGNHVVWIYKATEATMGAIVITKVAADHVKPVSVSHAPLIEFIGNSITCGAAADTSAIACGAGDYPDYSNAYMAYGPRVARDLGVNYILSSVSGIGVYRTWNRDSPSMPQVYENTDFQLSSAHPWNFKKYRPKIVSIALGTNDLSHGDGRTPRKPFEEDVFIGRYIDFIRLVKSKYPRAEIVLLSSPMVKGTSHDLLEKCLTVIKGRINAMFPKDKPIETFFFPPMEGQGCSGHPSVEQHRILAEELMPFYKELLK